MTESINLNSFSVKLLAASGAIKNEIIRSLTFTCGSNFVFLNSLGSCLVVKCGNFFLSYLVIASCTMRAFGKTCSCTSSVNCLINYHIVTESVNYFLFYLMVASCAMLASGKTCFCTCSINCLVNNDIVTESRNLFLSYLVVASCAMRACCKTCSCTSSVNCLVNYHIVTESVNYFLFYLVVASGAVRAFCKTCFCTCSINCLINYHIVTESVNYFLFYLVVASCAMLASGKTCFCTSSINCLVNNDIVTESFALCLTYGANTGSHAICAYPSVIFLNACGLSLSCLIPSHVIVITITKLSDIIALFRAVLTVATEDKTGNSYGNLDHINVVTFYSLCDGILKIYAGPSRVISIFAIPVEEVYCGPCPVIFEVNSYGVFKIKLTTYGANALNVYVIAKLGVFRINKTALAVLTLQASCRLCVLTSVRNRNCNVNSGAVECDNNDAAVFSNGEGLILTGISNGPIEVVVANDLELICALLYVLVYLSPKTVFIGHIVSCVSNVPLGASTKMSACTCYCKGSRFAACCAHMTSIEAGVSGRKSYDLFAIKTYLIFCTCCFRTAILVRTFGNGKVNLNVNGSTLKGDSNCTAFYVNLEGLISAGISGTPVVVASNLELICTCRNVLIYLSVYAVSESHIVIGISGAPIRTTKSC